MNRRDALKAVMATAPLAGKSKDAQVVSPNSRLLILTLQEALVGQDVTIDPNLKQTVKEALARAGLPEIELLVLTGFDVTVIDKTISIGSK